MKTKRILFIALGWVFIVFNALAYLGSINNGRLVLEDYRIPYILGYNFFSCWALLF